MMQSGLNCAVNCNFLNRQLNYPTQKSYKLQKYEIKLNQSLIIHFFMQSFLNFFFNERDNAFNMSSIIIITIKLSKKF